MAEVARKGDWDGELEAVTDSGSSTRRALQRPGVGVGGVQRDGVRRVGNCYGESGAPSRPLPEERASCVRRT